MTKADFSMWGAVCNPATSACTALVAAMSVFFLASCSRTPAPDRQIEAMHEKAISDCSKLPDDSRALCEAVAERQVANYEAYRKAHRTKGELLASHRESLPERVASARAGCAQTNTENCAEFVWLSRQLATAKASELVWPTYLAAASDRTYRALDGIAAAFTPMSRPKIICKVRDMGFVECVLMESLLASYGTETNTLILSDIRRLYDVFELDTEMELLLGCGPGVWGAADLEMLGTADLSEFEFVTGEAASSIMHECAMIQAQIGDGAHSLAGATGFSGVTGFDTHGLHSACGFRDYESSGSFDQILENFENLLETLRATCESSLTGTISEGSAEGEDAQTDGPAEDATVVSATTQSSTDEEGNTTVTTTTQYSDGTTVTTSNNYDADGNLVSSVAVTKDTTDGTTTTHIIDVQADGNRHHTIFGTGSNGKRYYGSYDTDSQGNNVTNWDVKTYESCLDETCQSCVDFSAFQEDMMQECISKSYTCSAYFRESECCSNEEAYPVDPRVVMPNPEGDMTCRGGVDPDVKSETCQQQCGVAEHEDCHSNCVSLADLGLDFDLMDEVCQQAISEACFSGPLIRFPQVSPLVGGVGPQPLPTSGAGVLEGLLLPPIGDRFGGGPELPS